MRFVWIILGLMGWQLNLSAQALSDSLPVLGWPALATQIIEEHPLAQRAQLNSRQGELLLREANGFFDPKLFGDWEQKVFEESNYFRVLDAGVKVSLPYGPRLSVGYQWTDGIFLDPSLTLPSQGQALLGIEMPLLQGLIFDPGRASIQKARMEQAGLDANQQFQINELLYQGVWHYVNWTVASNRYRLMQNALEVTRGRHVAIVQSYLLGELAGVDTVESFVQVQNRELEAQSTFLDQRKASLALANFLWGAQNVNGLNLPWSAPDMEVQRVTNEAGFPELEQSPELSLHPKMRELQAKAGALNVDERIARQDVLPQLDINYYLLGNGWDFSGLPTGEATNGSSVFAQNYKWGVKLSWPIFMRKGRAKQEIMAIKQEQNLRMQEATLRDLENKVEAYQQEMMNTMDQINLFEEAVNNYRRLMDAEIEKFRLGESSIFLVNSREQSLVGARDKLLQLYGKYYIAKASIVWAAGQLGL